MKAEVMFDIYKNKETSISHPDWRKSVDQIQTINMLFGEGDQITPETIAGGIKQALLRMNPEWKPGNILIG